MEKLQQEVKRETTKKDTATQALRDGLEIVKAKKLECETKVHDAEKKKEEYEMKIADLEQEVQRLKSVSSESDEKTVLVISCGIVGCCGYDCITCWSMKTLNCIVMFFFKDSSEKESGNSSSG